MPVYSTMFSHRHSQIAVDDGMQTYIQENTTHDYKQENTAYTDIPENNKIKYSLK